MATIAQLLVKMGVDTKDLQKGFSKATSHAKRFAKEFKDKTVAVVKAGIKTMTVAFAALSASIVTSVNSIDAMAKTAAKLGISVQALQQLQLAAKLSGVGVESLNMALQRMVRRVAEAAQGTGEAQGALKELGLDAQYLASLAPEKQFELIGKAISKIQNPSMQLQKAFKIFDSEGVAVVNTFKVNMQEVNKELMQMGVLLSDAQAQKVQKLSDSFTLLGTITKGIKDQMAALLAEPLTKIVDQTKEWIKAQGGAKNIAASIATYIISAFQAMSTMVTTVLAGIKMMATGFIMLGETINATWKSATAGFGFFYSYARQGLSDLFSSLDKGFNMSSGMTSQGLNDKQKGYKLLGELTPNKGGTAFDVAAQENMKQRVKANKAWDDWDKSIAKQSQELNKSIEALYKFNSKLTSGGDDIKKYIRNAVTIEESSARKQLVNPKVLRAVQPYVPAAMQASTMQKGASLLAQNPLVHNLNAAGAQNALIGSGAKPKLPEEPKLKIDVNVKSDSAALTADVVAEPNFANAVTDIFQKATQNAARQVNR